MPFGPPPPKDANAGAPLLGIKVTEKQKITGDYRIPGQTYLWREIELIGIHPGLLMANLETTALPLPGDVKPSGGFGVRAPKGSKKSDNAIGGGAVDQELAEEPPTDARDRKILKASMTSAYLSPTDRITLVCPAENLQSMFIDAGKNQPRTGLARACGSAIMIEPDFVPFLDPETNKPLKFGRNIRVVEHPVSSRTPPQSDVLVLLYKAKSSTGKRIATARPYLPAWKLRFRVGLDAFIWAMGATNEAKADEIFSENVLAYTSGYVGLMAWRPGAPKGPGRFGRYQIVKYEKVKA